MGDMHITMENSRTTQPYSAATALAPGNQAETCSALKIEHNLINRQTLMICNSGEGTQLLLQKCHQERPKKKKKIITRTCT